MALKSINISGNFDWCPFEEYKNYLICFNSHNLLYSNNGNLNNYTYLLDINLNSDIRTLDIVHKLNFEEALKRGNDKSSKKSNNEYVTSFEWINCNNFVESENESGLSKGIIVGGLTNGNLVLLNAKNLFDTNDGVNYDNFILSQASLHESGINCLECNKHKNNLIATGGNDGQLFITDIENIFAPTSYDPYLDKNNLQKITCLNWNKKVSHILATSSNNGNTVIWDLKIKKSAVSFRDPHSRTKTSSLCWLENQPTQILISYDDDKNPCLQLWDLRNSNYPIKEIIGHSKGINNICFSSVDSNLLLSSGKDVTKCWYLNSNNFDIYNEVNNSANNIYSKWSPFIPDMFASSTNVDTIQINSINNGSKMTSKYIPNFYKKDASICFGFGGKICLFDNIKSDTTHLSTSENAANKSMNPMSHSNQSSIDETNMQANKNKGLQNEEGNSNSPYMIKCHIYPTEVDLIEEADKFEKYIECGKYQEFCENKIAKCDDYHEKLTWKILQLLCTSQKEEIVKHIGYDMNEINQKIVENIGEESGFIFKKYRNETNDNINGTGNITSNNLEMNSDINNKHDNTRMSNLSNGENIPGYPNYGNNMQGEFSTSQMQENEPNFNESFDLDPEKFFRELGEKNEIEKNQENELSKDDKTGKDGLMGSGNKLSNSDFNTKDMINTIRGQTSENSLGEINEDSKPNSNKTNSNNWNSGIESIIKECLLVGNIEAAVELCLYQNRMADALLLSSFGGENLWHKTKNIYIKKQNDSFLRNINYVLDDKLEHLVKTIDLSSWDEALSILCTYAINNPNFNNLCEILAKRLQNEKFDVRSASICYLCASNFPETVEIWDSMPSSKSTLLNALQDIVEKITVLKMVIKYNKFNSTMNQKINQYAELLANSGRLKAAMTFLSFIDDDKTMESLTLRDRIFNSATHVMPPHIKPPPSPFQYFDVKPFGVPDKYNNMMNSNAHGIYNKSQGYPNKSLTSVVPPLSMSEMRKPHGPPGPMPPFSHTPPTKFSTQVIGGPPGAPRLPPQKDFMGSTDSASNRGYGTSNFGSNVKYPPPATGSLYIPPPSMPSHSTTPINPSPSPYASVPNLSHLSSHQNLKLEHDNKIGGPTMFESQSYSNVNKAMQNSVAPPPLAVAPPPISNQIPGAPRSSFSTPQSNIPPPFPQRNRHASVATPMGNPTQPNMPFTPESQLNKRESIDSQVYNPVTPPPISPMSHQNTFTPPQPYSQNKMGFAPPTAGVKTTSPVAGAMSITPGMPVPWPIPTTTQQLGSTTQSTASENKKIQTAAKEQNGVLMNRNNIEHIKKVISNLLNAYIAQEPVKKKADDISIKVNELFDKIYNGAFNEQINNILISLANSINDNDFKMANKNLMDISRNLWDGSNKAWIMGLKCIIPKC
ncbi:protein transport protein SEC31, putative [Plasmodium chabaudi chabaudi]|uniref:Protein transport protein SEC31, putative n=1 Tax=Plasmodium chabaudi chabaudi TaxID=31271 RepID=A0A1D3LBA3_PLACU|nr:protein transport protein SEC31, putative [Plasmodium chabaudi chabaudi]